MSLEGFAARLGAGPLDGETARLLACVGALGSEHEPAEPARGLGDLARAAGAVLVGVDGARARLQRGLDELAVDPAPLLHALDPILCRVDARWTWQLVRTHGARVGAGTFATLLAEVRGEVDVVLDERLAAARPAMRQVVAALRGQAFAFDRGWATRWDDARTLAIAARAVEDPDAALTELRARRADCPVGRVPGVVELAARGLAARGRSIAVAELADDLGAATHARWLGELILGGAIAPAEVRDALAASARAVEDAGDADDAPRDGEPILAAHLALGQVDAAVELAAGWRCPPPLFASLAFTHADAATADALLAIGAVDRLAACPREEWSARDGLWMTEWWLTAEQAGDGVRACRDVLALTTTRPWPSSMGSLVELVELTRATLAGR